MHFHVPIKHPAHVLYLPLCLILNDSKNAEKTKTKVIFRLFFIFDISKYVKAGKEMLKKTEKEQHILF